MNVGYARLSTQGQTLETQLEKLGKADCSKIYSEKLSGAKCDRPELQRLLKALEPGSVMVVTRLDRLGRSTIDLLTIVGFRSDLENMIKPFSKCVLEARLLGYISAPETEISE
jgi:DNA invertase Pin-like site-specific DNA recombinase